MAALISHARAGELDPNEPVFLPHRRWAVAVRDWNDAGVVANSVQVLGSRDVFHSLPPRNVRGPGGDA